MKLTIDIPGVADWIDMKDRAMHPNDRELCVLLNTDDEICLAQWREDIGGFMEISQGYICEQSGDMIMWDPTVFFKDGVKLWKPLNLPHDADEAVKEDIKRWEDYAQG